MATYAPLFTLRIEHNFFADNVCRALRFMSTPRADLIVKNLGLVIKNFSNGFSVFYDETNLEALQSYASAADEPLRLGFVAFSTDPLFAHYTRPSVYKAGSILYFDNQNKAVEAEGRYRLHREDFAGEGDFLESGSPLLDDLFIPREGWLGPVFAANIVVSESDVNALMEQPAAPGREYYISFQSEQTVWKYYLLGELVNEEYYINDQEERVEFVSAGETSLADSRVALTFRSTTQLPFQERSDRHFQLRDKNSAGGRVLIRRLPVAAPGHTSREIIDGAETLVSVLFINR